MKRTNKKGFTLVELVIVIAIIAILAAVLIPTFSGVVEKANQSKALQTARNEFTEGYAEALADDGALVAHVDEVKENEVIVTPESGDKNVAATNEGGFTLTTTNFVFTLDTNYKIKSVAPSSGSAYANYAEYVSTQMKQAD